MKNILLISVFCFLISAGTTAKAQNADSIAIKRIFTDALTDTTSYHNLRTLTGSYAGRLAGTAQSMKAVKWAEQLLKGMGLDTVYLQECKVRHWERGTKETGRVISAKAGNHELVICALGGSVPTVANGLTANVVEVKDYDELKKLGKEKVSGKIVFINHPADPSLYNTFAAYGGVAGYRVRGAVQAAYYGAIAMIDRSATTSLDNFPHTGVMHYADTVNKIPALSVSTLEADELSKWIKADPELKIFLKTSCTELPEAVSYNVIGELRGTEHPDEIIAFGGHLDCWDIGQGAHDDGAGVVQSIDILRLCKSLNLKTKHTIRVVVFMDEEMEQRGAKAYAEASKKMLDAGYWMLDKQNTSGTAHPLTQPYRHVAAIEADRGGFTPWGFSIDGTDNQVKKIQSWKNLLLPYGLFFFEKGGSGVDVGKLKEQGVPLLGLVPDSQRYFDYHHSANDTFKAVNIRELQLGTASMAAMVYLIDEYGL
ncbi:MAG: M20/M25/M40 family metallo-hydrolase [Bacteroidetes bacterium]|nr:M20/M25/M40 family metallo-hydrolase [Bacteroidota bacterium]